MDTNAIKNGCLRGFWVIFTKQLINVKFRTGLFIWKPLHYLKDLT